MAYISLFTNNFTLQHSNYLGHYFRYHHHPSMDLTGIFLHANNCINLTLQNEETELQDFFCHKQYSTLFKLFSSILNINHTIQDNGISVSVRTTTRHVELKTKRSANYCTRNITYLINVQTSTRFSNHPSNNQPKSRRSTQANKYSPSKCRVFEKQSPLH